MDMTSTPHDIDDVLREFAEEKTAAEAQFNAAQTHFIVAKVLTVSAANVDSLKDIN